MSLARTDHPNRFESAVDDFITNTRNLIGQESPEDRPPTNPGPQLVAERGIPSLLILDRETIRRYSHSIGESNPLYTDVAYGRSTPYESLLAPGPALVHVRYPADHGATRPHGYPVANFIAGVAWEFFDVIREGARFSSSKVLREVFEKPGAGRRLIFLVSDLSYWDIGGELKARAYGSLIQVPMPAMRERRAIPVDRLGEEMLYELEVASYSEEEAAEISAEISDRPWRGATNRWWDDVKPGQKLPPVVQPPYSMADEITYQSLHQGTAADANGRPLPRAFLPAFRRGRAGWGHPDHSRTHPVTRWPYTPGDEHEDLHLAPYRGQPLPFDFGIQRAQVPVRLLSDWMGDAGFVHRMYTAMRRPVFYGDVVRFDGTIIRQYVLECEGEEAHGGVAGRRRYGAVVVKIRGTNQRGELHCEGHATILLPTRADGPPQLPIPHPGQMPYVPLRDHRDPTWC